MWFFITVLLLWATTAIQGRLDAVVLPPLALWGWWTVTLYLCGVAALNEPFETIQARLMGLFGYAMLALYYVTMAGLYMEFVPTSSEHPDMWPTVNLVGPLLLATLGCMRASLQR